MLVIPAIDLLGGKCVRLSQGAYDAVTHYDVDPLEVARGFENSGAEWLHVVDLDGARTGEGINFEIIERIASGTSLRLEVGGGVRSLERARELLDRGVGRVVVGTKLVQDPELAERFFRELGDQVVAGLDARDGMLAASGWTEHSEVSAVDYAAQLEAIGGRRIILTDIGRDGMLSGPNLELLRTVKSATSLPVIQSGGVSSLDDIRTLAELGAGAPEGVIVGKALYEGRFSCAEAIQASEPKFATG